MRFIGIIEQNKTVVQSIIDFFLSKEEFSILFICQSLDEYKSVPVHNRKRADILFIEASNNYYDHFQQIKYLKSINSHYQIVLLYTPPPLRPGAICFLDRQQLKSALESNFSENITMQLKQGTETGENNHQPLPVSVSLLTTRETEIAELVITGLTNKAIGQALYISTYTVNTHLRRIFSKLSIKSRTELAFKMINL